MDQNNEKDELISIAMQIILHAGDARNYNSQALDKAIEGNFEEAKRLYELAKMNINKSHLCQTNIIQKEANGHEFPSCLLFNHAQDTLMTINSELLLSEKIIRWMEMMKSN